MATPIADVVRPMHLVVAHQPLERTGPGRVHRPHRPVTRPTGRPLTRLPGCDGRDHRLDDPPQHPAAHLLQVPLDPIEISRYQLRSDPLQLADEQRAQLLYNRFGQRCSVHRYPPWGPSVAALGPV